jgi:hypothetical protein
MFDHQTKSHTQLTVYKQKIQTLTQNTVGTDKKTKQNKTPRANEKKRKKKFWVGKKMRLGLQTQTKNAKTQKKSSFNAFQVSAKKAAKNDKKQTNKIIWTKLKQNKTVLVFFCCCSNQKKPTNIKKKKKKKKQTNLGIVHYEKHFYKIRAHFCFVVCFIYIS